MNRKVDQLGTLNIPTPEKCLQIIAETEMLDHIVLHSKQVCRVSAFLSDMLISAHLKLNRPLVSAAALLHDITKTRSFDTGENHAATGAKMISDLGYPEVGNIIGQHVRLRSFCSDAPPNEAEVVNYADKRVLHDTIVSLDERMDYILDRYATTAAHKERIKALWQETILLERKIFGYLPIQADDLIRSLAKHPADGF